MAAPNLAPIGFSKDFPLEDGMFTTAKVSVADSNDSNALAAIVNGKEFPAGDITVGHISLTAETGKVNVNPAAVGGTSVSFDLSASAQAGMGVYNLKQYFKQVPAVREVGARTETTINNTRDFSIGKRLCWPRAQPHRSPYPRTRLAISFAPVVSPLCGRSAFKPTDMGILWLRA